MSEPTFKTVLVDRRVDAKGNVYLSFERQVLSGGRVMSSEAHIFSMFPGMNLDTARGVLKRSFEAAGFPDVADSDWAQIARLVAAEWTPAVIAAAVHVPESPPVAPE